MLFDQPITLDTALQHQHAKAVLPTSLSSADIAAQWPDDIRRASFFSARTTNANYLSDAHRMIQSLVNGDAVVDPITGALRKRLPGEGFNPSLVRTRMQNYLRELGYQPDPAQRGGLLDLSSDRRVDLIIDTQTKMAQGFARHEAATDPDVIADFPADEMYRQRASKTRRDWDVTWNTARASLGASTSACLATSRDGPFIALKGDPIWTAISRFGNPYPPWDYGSGMWIRDADYDLADRLGVLATLKPAPVHAKLADPATLKPDIPQSMPAALVSSLLTSIKSLFS